MNYGGQNSYGQFGQPQFQPKYDNQWAPKPMPQPFGGGQQVFVPKMSAPEFVPSA